MEVPESVTEFWSIFNTRINQCCDKLNQSVNEVSEVRKELSRIQQFATESTPMLPLYDVKRTQEEIEKVDKLIKAELSKVPRRKFRFSSREKSSSETVTIEGKAESKTPVTKPPAVMPSVCDAGMVKLEDRKSEVHCFPRGRDPVFPAVLIRGCSEVTVAMTEAIGSVRLEFCEGSVFYFGPCQTSVYLENCVDCVVFAACHQLRIHQSQRCRLYARVNSHPIIEDCSEMRFSPYSLSYAGHDDDLKSCNLTAANSWDNVVDFRWHKSVASPHWSVLPAGERLERIVVVGGAGLDEQMEAYCQLSGLCVDKGSSCTLDWSRSGRMLAQETTAQDSGESCKSDLQLSIGRSTDQRKGNKVEEEEEEDEI